MSDIQEVLASLQEVRSKTLELLGPLSQDQLDWRPPESEGEKAWSLGEVFMHLAIDEVYVRELIATPLLEGVVPPDGVTFIPPPPPYGTAKDVIKFWLLRARLKTSSLLNNWPEQANLRVKHAGGLEEMNGLEWFEGYASHEAFHHAQIGELIQAYQSAA